MSKGKMHYGDSCFMLTPPRFGYIYIGTLCLARGFTTTAVSTLLPPASSKFASTTFLKLLNGELEWLHQLLL